MPPKYPDSDNLIDIYQRIHDSDDPKELDRDESLLLRKIFNNERYVVSFSEKLIDLIREKRKKVQEEKVFRHNRRVNFFLVFVSGVGLLVSLFSAWNAKEAATRSMEIAQGALDSQIHQLNVSQRQADFEYLNLQPFLVLKIADPAETKTKFGNVGGGVAANIRFIKKFHSESGADHYFISDPGLTGIALAQGDDALVDLRADRMLPLVDEDQLRKSFGCLAGRMTAEAGTWVGVIYENLKGESFYSQFFGSNTNVPYRAMRFEGLSDCAR
jgi:hypothetical protein